MGGFSKSLTPGKLFMSQFKPFQDIGQVGHALGQIGSKPKPGYLPPPPPAAHPSVLGSGTSTLKAQNATNGAGAAYLGSTVATSGRGDLSKTNTGKATLLGQ